MNNCFIYSNNHNHEDLRNLLTNFDNNMKMNDEKLKSLIEFISSTGRHVDSDECSRLSSPKIIKKPVMSPDVADSLMNQINNSQHEVFSLVQQFNDFQSTFGNSTKGNINKLYNDYKSNNSDDLGLSEIETDNGTNSRNNDDLDVFSVDPNTITFPYSMKKLELKKKNVFGNKLNLNNIYHFKQNWQLKLLSRKLKNMKKDISELKVSINEISVFKDKVKSSINVLENRVQKLSKSGSDWNSVMYSGPHIRSKNTQDDNESTDDSWGTVRTKFENLIVKNECHLNYMNCLLNQLLFVSTDDQRTQVLTQIQEIVSKTITMELIESSLENSHKEYFHSIDESHKNVKNITVDNIMNESIVKIQSNDAQFLDSELNNICETSARLLNIRSGNECIKEDFGLCHIFERPEETTNEELKLSTKIDMLIQSIEDLMKPFVDRTFDNNLKEEIYEKILKESETFFKEELANIKTLDSKSPLKEISNLSLNNFFKDHLSLRVWNCLSAFDNQLTSNCLTVLLTNLSEFLEKHLKSVLFIVEKLENNTKNEKAKCLTQILKHQFLSNKNEVDDIDINAVSSYTTDPVFTLNNGTTDINTTNENIKRNSLNQLDAEEKDWVCQAEKKETIGN